MVKALYTASKKPGLSSEEFYKHWFEVHGQLCARVPGLRRYVQNHGIAEAYPIRAMTHDGFSELWFDDVAVAAACARQRPVESARRGWPDAFRVPDVGRWSLAKE